MCFLKFLFSLYKYLIIFSIHFFNFFNNLESFIFYDSLLYNIMTVKLGTISILCSFKLCITLQKWLVVLILLTLFFQNNKIISYPRVNSLINRLQT